MTSLTQFDLFPLLPFELRIKIWGVALTTPRTVSISCKKGHLDTERRITLSFTSHTPPHPLLRVCHESRFETLNTYSYVPMFKTDVSPRCIYVNFTYDTIRCAAADLEYLGRESYMPLFIVLRDGVDLDSALTKRIRDSIKAALTARHVPNEIFQVAALPRTLSGKKMELPVKKLLMGTKADQVFKLDAMANAASVEWFVAFAERRNAQTS